MLADDLLELLGERVPDDHTRQVVAEWYVEEWYRRLRRRSGPARVLDLGCGAGDSVDVFRRFDPGVRWVGLDLPASTSQLEPYHSLSVGNFTPYGVALLVKDAGLEAVEFRPNIDGLALIVQRGMGMHPFFYRWWARESPLNRLIGLFGRGARLERRSVNAIKLLLCGQFCFLARKPPTGAPTAAGVKP